MAIIRPGSLVGAISGALGGAVFANTRAGLIVRPRGVRTGQAGAQLSLVQGSVGRVAAAWNALTDAQRAAWVTAAAARPYPNRLGVMRPLSGYQLYSMFAQEIYAGSPPAALAPPSAASIYAPTFVGVNFLEGGPWVLTTRGLPYPTLTPVEFGYVQVSRRATQTGGFSRGRRIASWSHPSGSRDIYVDALAKQVYLVTSTPFAAGVAWQVAGGFLGKVIFTPSTVGNSPWNVAVFTGSILSYFTGNTADFSLVGSPVQIGPSALQCSFTNAASVTRTIFSSSGLDVYPVRGHIFEFWTRLSGAGTERSLFFFGGGDANNSYRFLVRNNAIAGLQRTVGGAATNIAVGSISGFALDTWYRCVVEWGYAGSLRAQVYTTADALVMNVSGTDITYNSGAIGFGGINVAAGACLCFFDRVRITGRAA